MITDEMAKKYGVETVTEKKEKEPQANEDSLSLGFYYSFLNATDYITSKLAEGVATKEEYTEELEAREIARREIRRLEMM